MKVMIVPDDYGPSTILGLASALTDLEYVVVPDIADSTLGSRRTLLLAGGFDGRTA
jgi:hypothetical protein